LQGRAKDDTILLGCNVTSLDIYENPFGVVGIGRIFILVIWISLSL